MNNDTDEVMSSGSDGTESPRLHEARERARRRVARQREQLRPLALAMVVAVCVGAFSTQPVPGFQGKALAISASLVVFAVTLMLSASGRMSGFGVGSQSVAIFAMGASGVTLAALQPHAAPGLAAGAAVWMAIIRLPNPLGLSMASLIAVGTALSMFVDRESVSTLLATTLLSVLLGFVAYFLRQSRAGQERTELLMAELEDVREEQTNAAAAAERSRIAAELHDVLAHSLSGAAIQVQAALKVAAADKAEPRITEALERTSQLVKEGLANAKQAVGALRGNEMPGLSQIDSLISSYRDNFGLDVTIAMRGTPRSLTPDVGLAIYRSAQEALTNCARYAPGATVTVVLAYDDGQTTLTVENLHGSAQPGSADENLGSVGGGRGLAGMRERIERVGGHVEAGPVAKGWRVEVVLPA